MIKTRVWITIFGIIMVLCAVWMLLSYKEQSAAASIYHDGECVCSIDLSLVTESYELSVEDENGSNIIRVEPGRICIVSADCPDQICVHMGWSSGKTIVCLPHRLLIQFEATDFDAIAGGNG